MADQGSGQFLGLAGLRRSFLALDEQGPENELPLPRLLTQAMEHWGLDSLGALIEHANSNPGPNFSTLAPLVVQNAAEGDGLARELLEQGGRELAMLAALVIERMRKLEDSPRFTVPAIAVAGSILAKVPAVREALRECLEATYPEIAWMDAPADPVSGALWRARQVRNVL
jgi:N-acetylglucosamine kinase-like BadF-type ATPase